MACDHCSESSDTRRVSATGFFQADPCVRARLKRERRSFYELCVACVAHANAGGVIGVARSAKETKTAVTTCVLCWLPVTVIQTELVTRYNGRTTRQVLDVAQASRCGCYGMPAFVIGAAGAA
jgi:hypothetical protein